MPGSEPALLPPPGIICYNYSILARAGRFMSRSHGTLAIMAIDAYSPCPAGTGKKVKFCCPDLQSELEKIDRMIEGEQYLASIQHIDQLEAKGQHRACLMAIKSELLRGTNQLDAAKTYTAEFRERFPENAIAWAETAVVAVMNEGGQAALSAVQRSLSLCDGHIQGRTYEAIDLVANELLEEGRVVPGRALLHLLNVLNPEDRQVVDRILYFNRAANVPLMLKTDPGMLPCPAGAPYRAKFEAAMAPMKKATWQETADRLAALAKEVPDSPAAWNNLGRIRSWLGDDAGAQEALARYAALDVPLEDAVEADAFAALLDPAPLGDDVDLLRWSWEVHDPERLQELLLSDRRFLPLPVDASQWPVNETPPPRTAGVLLDRAAMRVGDALSRDSIPRTTGELLLFGRQTDRAARLEVIGISQSDAEKAKVILREIGGDTLAPAPEETVVGKVSGSLESLGRRWVPPQGSTREQIDALLKDDFRDEILNRWPESPMGILGGRSLRQAAAAAASGDRAAQIKCLAAILVMEQLSERQASDFDFNQLRSRLGLPTLGSIDPRQCDLRNLSLVRLARIEIELLDDEALAFVFHRAVVYRIVSAMGEFGRALVARKAFAGRPERVEAYRALVELAADAQEAIKIIDEARGESLAAGQSCAVWDLIELSHRFGQGDVNEAMRLMQHIESRHIKEPGVAQSLTRLLINAGLLNPDGTPVAMPARRSEAAPAAADPAKLWTPGSESPGAGGGKLWTPGA